MRLPRFTFILSSLLFFVAQGVNAELLVRVGDSVDAVRSNLGEPKIEFPLNGQLIQDYGSCVVISSNGVVISVKEQRAARPPEAANPQEQAPVKQTVGDLLAKANAGDAEAQFCLGYCYQTGTAVAINMDESIRWYTLAAMQGYVSAQHNLGVIYMTGAGVEKDLDQAYAWAFLAAENGSDTLIHALQPMLTPEQELAGRLRASRIRDGVEQPPYGTPDSTAPIAKKVKPSPSRVD